MLPLLLTVSLSFFAESDAAPPSAASIGGLTATAPAADLAWNVAVNLWQDSKPPASPGPVPPPPGSHVSGDAAGEDAQGSDAARNDLGQEAEVADGQGNANGETETGYVFVIESELLPIGTIVMTEDRVIKTLGRPPVVKLQEVVIRSSWRQPANVLQQVDAITAIAKTPIIADPLPPATPVTEPLD